MFEEQITESIEAGAPNITYSGNEGPKSPQQEQQMQMAQAQEEYRNYVMGQEEAGGEILPFEQWLRMTYEASRQGAAFGGIMGLDGRRKYGFGSSLKKFVRKIIPNEVSELAVKAAPFVAPFNAPLAGLMAGVGSFDQTGRIGSSLKAGLGTYAQGKIMSGIGGGGYQGGKTMNPFNKSMYTQFTKPIGTSSGIGKLFKGNFTDKLATSGGSMDAYAGMGDPMSTGMDLVKKPGFVESIGNKISSLIPESTLGKIALGGGAVALGTALLGGGPEETVSAIMDRGEGLDIAGIRAEVTEAFKDQTGEKLLALRSKYPYLGTAASKNTAIMANGGRIGYGDGGLTEYESYRLKNMGYDTKGGTVLEPFGGLSVLKDILRVNKAMGGRIGKAEGGIMDLGGMELDYRAEGGFVPIGAKEKADDVPARLSVNEFVFTADAVRNAGGGDIDQGAEIMERVMKNLEQGGQISEETQGMSGAQEMFQTSQRLGEVI